MPQPPPRPISAAELRARQRRVLRIDRRLGFVGREEYRHVSTNSGGAQYGIGRTAGEDLLVVFPRAFERDTDPADFSLEAMIAHERGHQLLVRHPVLVRAFAGIMRIVGEEVLASIVGAAICPRQEDRDCLEGKAVCELIAQGNEAFAAAELVRSLRTDLERYL